MKVINQLKSLKEELSFQNNQSIGYVPTMGALHQGHLSLVKLAKKKSQFVIASIFVNPTQFNNKNDLKKYPRSLENDLDLLNSESVDLVFCPSYNELYANEKIVKVDLMGLDKTLEGSNRKGHFEGVIRVLNIFFSLIKPDFAFFGEKDYQQYLIVEQFAKTFFPKLKIVSCPTLRESNGLAMSSRNRHLNEREKELASEIYKTLLYCRNNYNKIEINKLEEICFQKLSKFSKPEYFEIRNSKNLSKELSSSSSLRAFVATKLSDIRLIDNIAMN